MLTPTVMMISVTGEAVRTGLTVSRSITMPIKMTTIITTPRKPRQRDMPLGERDGKHGAQHGVFALRQVDDPGHAVDCDDPQCDQHVDAARAETGQDELQIVTDP